MIGISKEGLWDYLESKFRPGMTRDNYGSVWVVDHFFPMAWATNKKDVLRLCHYTNLQPLFKHENSTKSSKNALEYLDHGCTIKMNFQ